MTSTPSTPRLRRPNAGPTGRPAPAARRPWGGGRGAHRGAARANRDGHDADAVDAAIAQAKRSADRPTLICCKTVIGKGSPNRAGSAKAHGEALGLDEVKLTRAALVWAHEPFVLP